MAEEEDRALTREEALAQIMEFEAFLRPTPLEIAVNKRNHAGVHCFLKAHKEEVNSYLNFGTPYASLLTGLEWALWNHDWKMCALFFVHGADPNNNAFDGVLETMGSLTGYGEQDILDGFSAADPQPIKGFAGLKALPNNGTEIGNAYLYIMERIYYGAIDLKADYSKLASCVDMLAHDLDYSAADLKAFVIASLIAFRSMGLPCGVALSIVEKAVIDTLWSLLESFATGGLAGDGAE